jgi:hypothetical protein
LAAFGLWEKENCRRLGNGVVDVVGTVESGQLQNVINQKGAFALRLTESVIQRKTAKFMDYTN